MENKIYRIMSDIRYCGRVLPPGTTDDLNKLDQKGIARLKKAKVIIDEADYQKQIKVVDNADSKAKRIIDDAEKQAQKIINDAKSKAKEIINDANASTASTSSATGATSATGGKDAGGGK